MPPGKPTVVIVEDDLPTLELYCRELSTDYQVFGTLDEQDALVMIARTDIDAIILEPGREDGCGWELLRRIRQALPNKTVPVVLCSSLDERRRGFELGAAAYLVKPVLPTELRDIIQRVLSTQARPNIHRSSRF